MSEILSEKQKLALNNFNSGNNIFLTGPGGSGKTFLIKKIVKICNEKKLNSQVCALTGCAAVLLECNAKTIHSWSGLKIPRGDSDDIIRRICRDEQSSPRRNRGVLQKRWRDIDVLIIDEVSMMSKKIFDILNKVAQIFRQNNRPFGGIQMVFSGDFFQLSPVGDKLDPESSQYCFESDNWKETFPIAIQLEQIFRQTDKKYIKALNQIRKGIIKTTPYKLLCSRRIKPDDEIQPTILLPHRKTVDKINSSELEKIVEEEKQFEVIEWIDEDKKPSNARVISPKIIKKELNYLKKSIIAEEVTKLKKGAKVMCIANIDMDSEKQIVNGSQGIIVDFIGEIPIVRLRNGKERLIRHHTWTSEKYQWIGIKHIPLILSWAITIHKAQGVTLESAQIDIGSNIFAPGQIYVALSRVKTIDGLYLLAFDASKISAHPKVKMFYENLSL